MEAKLRPLRAPSDSIPEEAIPRALELQERLEKHRTRILEALRNYPTPITACDDQFNTLLAQRDAISAELDDLAALLDLPRTEMPQALARFLERSAFLKDTPALLPPKVIR